MVWLKIALRKDTVIRSLKVGAVVGSVLFLINNGDFLTSGQFEKISALKAALTYCVPYAVSTYASVSALVTGQTEEE